VELLNATSMPAAYTLGADPSARERLVVVIKGTFLIPDRADREPELAEKQVPPVMADEFTGEPGMSATLYESEFPPLKPRCDVLLNGSAYAPHGRPAEAVTVGLRVGRLQKSFQVIGSRVWDKVLFSVTPTDPQPFEVMPLSYDCAYGGMDEAPDDPENRKVCAGNPVGTGYYPLTRGKRLVGKPLANTAEIGNPQRKAGGNYRPMAFGPIGRNFAPRPAYAGTYDQNWVDNVFPFLPADFDPLYYQSAPQDQQMDFPAGGEEVELINLTPGGHTEFRLPKIDVPVEFTNAAYERTELLATLDTVIIEPDQNRLMLVWRASMPLKKNIFEMKQAVVGRMTRAWYRARDTGKTYYASLGHLARTRQEELAEAEIEQE
jgi:hypothetical protein